MPKFSADDPLFPKTLVGQSHSLRLAPVGLTRAHWQTTQPIRNIFERAFEAAGIPYFHPHSFRHTLVAWAKHRRMSQAEWEAFSENIGHSSSRTTSQSYGRLSEADKSTLVRSMAASGDNAELKSRLLEAAARLG